MLSDDICLSFSDIYFSWCIVQSILNLSSACKFYRTARSFFTDGSILMASRSKIIVQKKIIFSAESFYCAGMVNLTILHGEKGSRIIQEFTLYFTEANIFNFTEMLHP